MSYTKLIDCDNVYDYDLNRIYQELLVLDGDAYKLRSVTTSDVLQSPFTCENKDNWDQLRIMLEVTLLGDDGLLYLNLQGD